jgi:hypothetical protein
MAVLDSIRAPIVACECMMKVIVREIELNDESE